VRVSHILKFDYALACFVIVWQSRSCCTEGRQSEKMETSLEVGCTAECYAMEGFVDQVMCSTLMLLCHFDMDCLHKLVLE